MGKLSKLPYVLTSMIELQGAFGGVLVVSSHKELVTQDLDVVLHAHRRVTT